MKREKTSNYGNKEDAAPHAAQHCQAQRGRAGGGCAGGRRAGARGFLSGLVAHLGDACVGSVSEVFDAEPPFTPRGCIAQAWSVAEVLRAWVKTED